MDLYHTKDNIVASATSNGYSAIAVIKLSGSSLLKLGYQLILHKHTISHKKVLLCNFYDVANEIIDFGLLLYFKSPNSFTGEDVVEIHSHGSPIIQQLIIKRCLELGCRIANPGEFTYRAYLNGKLDLVQAESIVDLIYSESVLSAKSALRSLNGAFSHYIQQLNETFIEIRSIIESVLDFPEEDDVKVNDYNLFEKIDALLTNMHSLMMKTKQAAFINRGVNIILVGNPNVGKSSLLNALSDEEVAIVTDIPGTTRDLITKRINIQGVIFNIIDTAGIRETTNKIEQIGISKVLTALKTEADFLLLVTDNDDFTLLDELDFSIPYCIIHNKIDLYNKESSVITDNNITHIYLSALYNDGIELLKNLLINKLDINTEVEFTARDRHLLALEESLDILNSLDLNKNLELIADDIRYAHQCLCSITGKFTTDDLLGEIFSKFCIGK